MPAVLAGCAQMVRHWNRRHCLKSHIADAGFGRPLIKARFNMRAPGEYRDTTT